MWHIHLFKIPPSRELSKDSEVYLVAPYMFNFFFFNFNFILFYLTFFNRRIKAAPFLRQNCLLQSGSVVSPIHCELKAWSVSCHLDHILTSRCQATVWQKREVSLTVIEILLTIFTYSKLAIIIGFYDRFSFFVFFFLIVNVTKSTVFRSLK